MQHVPPRSRQTPLIDAFRSLSFISTTLREAPWLTAHRARVWCSALFATLLGIVGVWIALSSGGVDRFGHPLGTDFISFWTASKLALAGHASQVYVPEIHFAEQRALFPKLASELSYTAFFYPPIFLLLCLPVALLPYLVALGVWVGAGGLGVFALARRLLPQSWAMLPIAACPAITINALGGQNGFLSTICLGGGMLLLDSWPFLSGACFGVLVFKPQLLLAVPVVLLAAKRWSAIAGALTSSLGLFAFSWLVLGKGAWLGFLNVSPLARQTLELGLVQPGKLQTVFSAIRVLHGGLPLAYAVQIVVALGVGAVLVWSASARPGGRAEGALIAAAAPLCTPFSLDYDLVCLILPLAWVTAEAQKTGWRPWEKSILLCAYVMPLLARPLALRAGLPIAPFVEIAFLYVAVRRLATQPRGDHAERRISRRGAEAATPCCE